MKKAHVGPTIEHYLVKLKASKHDPGHESSKYFKRKLDPGSDRKPPNESQRDSETQRTESSGSHSQTSGGHKVDTQRNARKEIAAATLDAMAHGSYLQYDLGTPISLSKQGTRYFGPDSQTLSAWAATQPSTIYPSTRVSLLEISTIEGCRFLATDTSSSQPRKLSAVPFPAEWQ